MTFREQELRAGGVSEAVLEFRRWRRATRLTQTEVAELVGVHPTTIVELECGKRAPRFSTLCKLRALSTAWCEALRPPRKPERRGTYPRRARRDALRPPPMAATAPKGSTDVPD